jgi:hypothetical protein
MPETVCSFYNYFVHFCTVVGAAVAPSVWCLITDWTTGVRSPTLAEDFSSSLCLQTGSVAHPASCTMGTGGVFPGGKARSGREADHSPPPNAEVDNEELYLLSPQTPSWRVAVQLYLYCTVMIGFKI